MSAKEKIVHHSCESMYKLLLQSIYIYIYIYIATQDTLSVRMLSKSGLSRGSSVSIVMGCRMHCWDTVPITGRKFVLAISFKKAVGPTQVFIKQMLFRVCSHLGPPNADVKNSWSYTSIPLNIYMLCYVIMNHNSYACTFQPCAAY
jgi:hypothetical protein